MVDCTRHIDSIKHGLNGENLQFQNKSIILLQLTRLNIRQTAGNHINLLGTKSMSKRFSVQVRTALQPISPRDSQQPLVKWPWTINRSLPTDSCQEVLLEVSSC